MKTINIMIYKTNRIIFYIMNEKNKTVIYNEVINTTNMSTNELVKNVSTLIRKIKKELKIKHLDFIVQHETIDFIQDSKSVNKHHVSIETVEISNFKSYQIKKQFYKSNNTNKKIKGVTFYDHDKKKFKSIGLLDDDFFKNDYKDVKLIVENIKAGKKNNDRMDILNGIKIKDVKFIKNEIFEYSKINSQLSKDFKKYNNIININIGNKSSEILQMQKNIKVANFSFNVGKETLLKMLLSEIGSSPNEASEIVDNFSFESNDNEIVKTSIENGKVKIFTKEDVRNIIENIINVIIMQVSNMHRKILKNNNTYIVISGLFSNIDGIDKYIVEKFSNYKISVENDISDLKFINLYITNDENDFESNTSEITNTKRMERNAMMMAAKRGKNNE